MPQPAKNDGGTAFPMTALEWGGMSLRDFFAASALTGLLSFGTAVQSAPILAYRAADEMLAVRDRKV
jgi:hypothetical protein